MPLSSRYRRILVANLHIKNEERVPPHVPRYSFQRVKDIILEKFNRKLTTYLFQKETRQIRIKDISEMRDGEHEYLCLLLSLSDKDAPDAVYEDFSNGEIRRFPKNKNEGNAITSHILICQSSKYTSPYHLTLIEKATGLTTSNIERYLNYLLKDENFTDTYEKDGQQKSYRPLFEILGHKSNTIRMALENGILQDIEFVSHQNRNGGFDEYNYIKEQKEECQFVIQDKIKPNIFKNLAKTLKNKPDLARFEHMFIRIKDDADGSIKRAEIDPETNFLENAFIQTELLKDFDAPLEQAHAEVRADMLSKMIKIMDKTLKRTQEQDENIIKKENNAVDNSKAPVLSAD